MVAIVAWLEGALERAHAVMVRHFVRVTDDPATGMRECAEVIRAAAEISAFNKAKVCAERQGEPAMVGLATEEVIALAATPMRSPSVTGCLRALLPRGVGHGASRSANLRGLESEN